VEAVVRELFSIGLYKRSQGRIARQATFVGLALIIALGAWALTDQLTGFVNPKWTPARQNIVQYGIPLALLVLGLWASFRVVNIPAFADFLISVEGEMNKVSWPSRSELFRASVVVILVIFFLAALLFGHDALLSWIMMGIDGLVDRMFG